MLAIALVVAAAVAARWRPVQAQRVLAFQGRTWDGRQLLDRVDATLSDEFLARKPLSQLQDYSVEWIGALVSDTGCWPPGAFAPPP